MWDTLADPASSNGHFSGVYGQCSRRNIFDFTSHNEQCTFIRGNCEEFSKYLNMLNLQYCNFRGNFILSILVLVFLYRFLIRIIAYISDVYLSAAIARVSKKMRLSQTLAGATLLALSNGATDIITVFIAAGVDKKDGDYLPIGGLFGASLFSFTIVLAYVIYKSPRGIISNVSSVLEIGIHPKISLKKTIS